MINQPSSAVETVIRQILRKHDLIEGDGTTDAVLSKTNVRKKQFLKVVKNGFARGRVAAEDIPRVDALRAKYGSDVAVTEALGIDRTTFTKAVGKLRKALHPLSLAIRKAIDASLPAFTDRRDGVPYEWFGWIKAMHALRTKFLPPPDCNVVLLATDEFVCLDGFLQMAPDGIALPHRIPEHPLAPRALSDARRLLSTKWTNNVCSTLHLGALVYDWGETWALVFGSRLLERGNEP